MLPEGSSLGSSGSSVLNALPQLDELNTLIEAARPIQAQLGHSRIETTAQYLRSLVPSEAIKTLKGSEWVEPG